MCQLESTSWTYERSAMEKLENGITSAMVVAGTQAPLQMGTLCTQAHSRSFARLAMPMDSWLLRRRGRLVRRSRSLHGRRRAATPAALHRKEPGEPEDEEVERADHGR